MMQKRYQLLLAFGFLFLSNSSAFLTIIWLSPEIVRIEALFFLVLTTLSFWILNKNNKVPQFFAILKENWILFPFFIFSGFSLFWSVYFEISLFRWLIFTFTVITGGYLGIQNNLKQLAHLLSIFGVYILFLSSMLVFFTPNVGIMNYHSIEGAWKGLYWHKNHMGLIAAFVNILFLINIISSWQSGRKNVWAWGLLYFFSLFFMYKSDSAAAQITILILHGVILLLLVWLKYKESIRKVHYLILAAILLISLFVLSINIDLFLAIFNRNTTLTGRIPMWTYLFSAYFSQHPFFGYGFNAFWYIEPYRIAVQQAAGYPDQIVIADNGFIDILVNTGYIGLFLFLIFYVGVWWRSIQYAGKATDVYGLFPLILMFFTLLANISWSLMFENEGFFMLIMIAVLFSISNKNLAGSEN